MNKLSDLISFPKNIELIVKELVRGTNWYYAESLEDYYSSIDKVPTGRSGISITYLDSIIIAKVHEDSSIFNDKFSMHVTEGMNIGRVIDYSNYNEYKAWISRDLGIAVKNQKVLRNSFFAYKKEIEQHYLIDGNNITNSRKEKNSIKDFVPFDTVFSPT